MPLRVGREWIAQRYGPFEMTKDSDAIMVLAEGQSKLVTSN
jgi:hypothetical protein